MPATVQYAHDDGEILIVVDEAMPSAPPYPAGPTQRGFGSPPEGILPRVGGAGSEAPLVGKLSIDDAVAVVGRLSDAFSKALATGPARPSEVEIEFGLEASADLGGLIVGKISGKANFNVKMTWKTTGEVKPD